MFEEGRSGQSADESAHSKEGRYLVVPLLHSATPCIF